MQNFPALSVDSESEFAEFLQDRETYGKLLCKGKRYSWSSACQSAFDELKKKLVSAPMLSPPDESQPFQVFCGASLQEFGGVLMQGENFVACTSRQLKSSE